MKTHSYYSLLHIVLLSAQAIEGAQQRRELQLQLRAEESHLKYMERWATPLIVVHMFICLAK